MRRYLLALLTFIAVTSPAIAQEITHVSHNGLPQEVAAHIHNMADACEQVRGNPLADPRVEHGNLDAGTEFWAIDEGTFKCQGAESLFSGSHGSDAVVYVSAPHGRATEAFVNGAFGMTIEHTGHSSTLWIRVGGQLCGQKGNPTTAELISCERPLKWDANIQKLDFAPLSEARIAAPTAPSPDLRAGASVELRAETLFSPTSGPVCRDYSKPEFGYWVCPGPGGFAIAFMDEGNIAGITIGPANSVRKAVTTAQWLGASKVFGEKVQWVVRTGVPKAAVIRIWRRKDVDDPTEIQELAVYAIDGRRTCAFGAVDIHQARANEVALAKAEEAAGSRCPEN
jgi:hypothetical protein